MPRKIIISQPQFPYHIYNRSIDKEFFDVPMNLLWKIFCDQAYSMTTIWNGHIHAAVLMHNHFHLLISTPDSNIGECMCDFQSEIARNISLLKGTDGYRFASRYKWSIVKNESHFTTVLKYIYQNPVRAKIVRNAETYPYSTLRGLLGLSKLQIPIKPHEMGREFFEHPASDWLDSINCKFDSKEVAAIQAGLRRAEFKVAGSRISAGKRGSLGG